MLEIFMFSLYDFDKRVNTCSLLLSDKRCQKHKVAQRHLVYRGISVYIKRHLMSGNEFACSLGSSSAKILV